MELPSVDQTRNSKDYEPSICTYPYRSVCSSVKPLRRNPGTVFSVLTENIENVSVVILPLGAKT
jgi:hypothetical protein